jgi:hypothetical protein
VMAILEGYSSWYSYDETSVLRITKLWNGGLE